MTLMRTVARCDISHHVQHHLSLFTHLNYNLYNFPSSNIHTTFLYSSYCTRKYYYHTTLVTSYFNTLLTQCCCAQARLVGLTTHCINTPNYRAVSLQFATTQFKPSRHKLDHITQHTHNASVNHTLNDEAFVLLDMGCNRSVISMRRLPRLNVRDNPSLYQGRDTVHGN